MIQRPKTTAGENVFNPTSIVIDQRREVLNRCLDEIEKRYVEKFSVLESIVIKLRNNRNYLYQKLAAFFPTASRG